VGPRAGANARVLCAVPAGAMFHSFGAPLGAQFLIPRQSHSTRLSLLAEDAWATRTGHRTR